MQALLGHEFREAPGAGGDDGHARSHRLERGQREDLGVAGWDDGDRGVAAQLGERLRTNPAGEVHVGARASARSSALRRPLPGDHQRKPCVAAAVTASATPFSRLRRPT